MPGLSSQPAPTGGSGQKKYLEIQQPPEPCTINVTFFKEGPNGTTSEVGGYQTDTSELVTLLVDDKDPYPIEKDTLDPETWRCFLWALVESRDDDNSTLEIAELLAHWLDMDLKEIHVAYKNICEREARERKERLEEQIKELDRLISMSEEVMEKYPNDFALKLSLDSLKGHRKDLKRMVGE